MNELLKLFTNTILAQKQFREKHKEVFDEFNQLEELRTQQESDLKTEARETGEDLDNGVIKVQVIKKYHKWYDPTVFDKAEREILTKNEALVIKEEIIKEKLEELAKQELISRETIRKSYRDEELSPAVKITINL